MFSPAGPCLLRLLGCVAAFNAPASSALLLALSVEEVFVEKAEKYWNAVC